MMDRAEAERAIRVIVMDMDSRRISADLELDEGGRDDTIKITLAGCRGVLEGCGEGTWYMGRAETLEGVVDLFRIPLRSDEGCGWQWLLPMMFREYPLKSMVLEVKGRSMDPDSIRAWLRYMGGQGVNGIALPQGARITVPFDGDHRRRDSKWMLMKHRAAPGSGGGAFRRRDGTAGKGKRR